MMTGQGRAPEAKMSLPCVKHPNHPGFSDDTESRVPREQVMRAAELGPWVVGDSESQSRKSWILCGRTEESISGMSHGPLCREAHWVTERCAIFFQGREVFQLHG